MLYTTVVPVIFLVSVFTGIRLAWYLLFSVGIVLPFFVPFSPFFLKRGARLLKKGTIVPLLRKKGGFRPLFDTEMYRPSFPSVLVW